jgi:hypothetical protein
MSAGLGALIAHTFFWVLLGYGVFWEDLSRRSVLVFLLLWAVGYAGFSLIPVISGAFFSWVALLDVALVFIMFKGDVRLT